VDISVSNQAAALLGALVMGVAVGLVYDLIRIPRAYIRIPLLGAVLDLLFWLAVTAALFLYAIYAGGGEVRIYMAAALFGGALGYFLLISPWVRRFSGVLAAGAATLGRWIAFPIRKLASAIKKLKEKLKNSFSSYRKRYKMKQIPGKAEAAAMRDARRQGRRRKWQKQKRQDS
jgi:spore cortex biosynthesis protein YabQ